MVAKVVDVPFPHWAFRGDDRDPKVKSTAGIWILRKKAM
jgi:hypothetical protein